VYNAGQTFSVGTGFEIRVGAAQQTDQVMYHFSGVGGTTFVGSGHSTWTGVALHYVSIVNSQVGRLGHDPQKRISPFTGPVLIPPCPPPPQYGLGFVLSNSAGDVYWQYVEISVFRTANVFCGLGGDVWVGGA
jgi:hypothetical protein